MDINKITIFCKENAIDFFLDEPMGKHTSFKTGGKATVFAVPSDFASLVKLKCFTKKNHICTLIIGNGSNLLVSENGFKGVVISTIGLNKLEWLDERTVHAQAGAMLSGLSVAAMLRGLSGLEFAQGIPGSVGGGVFMNAGAYDGEVKDTLISTQYLDEQGNILELPFEMHNFGYRHSVFKEKTDCIILSSTFKLNVGDINEIRAKMNEFATKRREKQPTELPSAGSTFKRPAGTFAAKLIEECGLKGYKIGGAQVSEKHAGFIVNVGGATPEDIIALIEHVENSVFGQSGVRLEREICIV